MRKKLVDLDNPGVWCITQALLQLLRRCFPPVDDATHVRDF